MQELITPNTTAPTDLKQYATACEVHAQILNSAKAAQENLYQMAMGFKRMRDEELYKQLGYGSFGDYCENETGMRRTSVYGYISIAERLPEDFVRSIGQSLGVAKLQLLTSISEEQRQEITETVDLESTTVKELKAEIAKLKEDKQAEISALATENEGLKKRNDELARYSQSKSEAYDRMSDESEENFNKYQEAQAQASKLQSEVYRLKNDSEAKIREKDSMLFRLKHRYEELQKQLEEAEKKPQDVAVVREENTEKADALARELDEVKRKLDGVQREKNLAEYYAAAKAMCDSFNRWIEYVKMLRNYERVQEDVRQYLHDSAKEVKEAMKDNG